MCQYSGKGSRPEGDMMKRAKKTILASGFILITTIFILGVSGGVAIAENTSGTWRSTYDGILLWVNFFIIVFLVVKFGKTPLMNFLRSQKEKLSEEISRIEEEKNNTCAGIKNAHEKIEKNKIHLEELKKRFIRQGETEKKKILEDANQQSMLMIENAKQKIEARIQQKKDAFRSEMIDAAFDMANKKIPQVINEEDNKKLVDIYLENASITGACIDILTELNSLSKVRPLLFNGTD